MKILFTGGSSFTGYWFIKTLKKKNHNIYATFTKDNHKKYRDIRHERVKKILERCNPVWNCKFGDKNFINLIEKENFDVLCHHAADVTNYKSPDFDYINAVNNNTYNIKKVINALQQTQCNTIILTGSVFEQYEGCGSKPLEALSPYGLSKGLTFEIFNYYTQINNIKFGKFVIPNPFGPFEEQRFTSYLIKTWKTGEVPKLKTPKYIRDNIHISLLAKVYAYFVQKVFDENYFFQKINPSGYTESQESFTERFSKEISKRTRWNCKFESDNQIEFTEPAIRINGDIATQIITNWDENQAWNDVAKYYINL